MPLSELLDKIKLQNSQKDTALIERAYQFAEKSHHGQMRLSGDPYIVHCLEVGKILAELQLDLITIVSGLLHDTIEDTATNQEKLTTEFGLDIATLVAGVSKISAIAFRSQEERLPEN